MARRAIIIGLDGLIKPWAERLMGEGRLPALQQLDDCPFRLIKYSRFPPLSLLTIAGLTPADRWEIIVRDEHVESSEVSEHVDLVGIQTYISSSGRAYELADRWRERGAKVVLGGLHPTSLPTRPPSTPTPSARGRPRRFGATFWRTSRTGG